MRHGSSQRWSRSSDWRRRSPRYRAGAIAWPAQCPSALESSSYGRCRPTALPHRPRSSRGPCPSARRRQAPARPLRNKINGAVGVLDERLAVREPEGLGRGQRVPDYAGRLHDAQIIGQFMYRPVRDGLGSHRRPSSVPGAITCYSPRSAALSEPIPRMAHFTESSHSGHSAPDRHPMCAATGTG